MSNMPQNSQQSFLPTTLILPPVSDGEEFNYILTDFIKKMISSINQKDIGQYVLQEIQNGQQFFKSNSSNQFRNIYRKVIEFGALPNAGTKEINHEISVDSSTRFTRIYGTANHPDTTFIPLPFASPTDAENIKLEVNPQTVLIETAQDYSSFTETFVILEYLKA